MNLWDRYDLFSVYTQWFLICAATALDVEFDARKRSGAQAVSMEISRFEHNRCSEHPHPESASEQPHAQSSRRSHVRPARTSPRDARKSSRRVYRPPLSHTHAANSIYYDL